MVLDWCRENHPWKYHFISNENKILADSTDVVFCQTHNEANIVAHSLAKQRTDSSSSTWAPCCSSFGVRIPFSFIVQLELPLLLLSILFFSFSFFLTKLVFCILAFFPNKVIFISNLNIHLPTSCFTCKRMLNLLPINNLMTCKWNIK